MAGAASIQSLRKALGSLKDSTKVGFAKVNSDNKDVDIAVVKATNHVEHIAKEKHIRTIFSAVAASRPRADVVYCISALAKRLSKTHNWAVALKTLIMIHRALREVDSTFREELINFTKNRGHILNLSHFKDDSSPIAWDYSAWVRVYALYLEERLECFSILKYDVEAVGSRTRELDTPDLLEHLPALQQLLFRLFACQPEGAAAYNNVILYALSLVAGESVRIYTAISDATLNLVDKFFDMQQHDAVRALEIYKKAGNQSERLSEFYEALRSLEFGKKQKYIKIEKPPASFLTTMEEYVKEAPRALMLQWNVVNDDRGANLGTPDSVLSIMPKSEGETEDDLQTLSRELEASTIIQEKALAPPLILDLLGLDENDQDDTALDETDSLAPAVISSEDLFNVPNGPSASTDWEVALVTAGSSNTSALAESKLGGGLDKLTLDSLYEDAMTRRANQNTAFDPGQVVSNPFESALYMEDPFFPSNPIAPTSVQMEDLTRQQQEFMIQRHLEPCNPTDAHMEAMPEKHQYQHLTENSSSVQTESEQQEEIMIQQQNQEQSSAVVQNPTNPFGEPYFEHHEQDVQRQNPFGLI